MKSDQAETGGRPSRALGNVLHVEEDDLRTQAEATVGRDTSHGVMSDKVIEVLGISDGDEELRAAIFDA